jgi:putative transposase
MSALASFSDSSRQSALQRFQLLRVHLEDGRSLAAIAGEAKISYRTLQNWLERYRASGLAALARKPRIDCGRRRKLSTALQEAIVVTPAQQGAKAYGNSFVELPQLD